MIYILYDYFYPAYKAGGPIKSLVNLVMGLENEIDLAVVCSNKDLDGTGLAVATEQWAAFGHSKVYYAKDGFNEFKKVIDKQEPVLFINGMYSLQYNFLPALFLKGRKIVSVRGMLHTEAVEQKRFKKNLYLFAWKMLGLHRKCEYHSTSLVETAHIKNRFGNNTKVWTIPNLPSAIDQQLALKKNAGELVLATVALISPMKNHLLILQALAKCTAPVTYHIYGPVKDEQYWQKCSALIASMPANIRVLVHGEIAPARVVAAIAQSHVIIQPSKSENFGHSLLEAMNCGRPLITSRFTPWNALEENKAGMNVSIENENEILDAINFFVQMNEDEFETWSNAAKKFASRSIDVDSLKAQYLQMFRSVA